MFRQKSQPAEQAPAIAHANGGAADDAPSVLTPERVLDALRPVEDPEIGVSIVDLGLMRGIEVEDETGQVRISLTLTSPMCPMGPEIVAAVKQHARAIPGVTHAEVQLVWRPPWDPRIDATDEVKAELGIWD